MHAFAEKRGQASLSFVHQPRADISVAHADVLLRMENEELLLFFESQRAKFKNLQNAMISFELAKSGSFTRALEATRECFQNEWGALDEAGPRSFGNAKRHGRKFTKNTKACRRILLDRMVKTTARSEEFADGRSNSTQARARQKPPGHQRSTRGRERAFESRAGPNGRGNAKRERAEGRPQHPVATAVGRDGFSCAHNRQTAAARRAVSIKCWTSRDPGVAG
ncbi:hypothetical protein TRVL_08647 [Trypanosoma vivax]|nr:hypothetical protein TRVL_08647 [Trypanosoma vivax]